MSHSWVIVLKFRSARVANIVQTIETVSSQARNDSSSAGFDSVTAVLAISRGIVVELVSSALLDAVSTCGIYFVARVTDATDSCQSVSSDILRT